MSNLRRILPLLLCLSLLCACVQMPNAPKDAPPQPSPQPPPPAGRATYFFFIDMACSVFF